MDATDQRLYLLPSRATKRTLILTNQNSDEVFEILAENVSEHQKASKEKHRPLGIRCEITPIPLVRKIFAMAWANQILFFNQESKERCFFV